MSTNRTILPMYCLLLVTVSILWANKETQFEKALASKNYVVIDKMLKDGFKVESLALYHHPFLTAAFNGDLQMVEVFVKNNVDVNMKNDYLGTALGHAAFHGHENIINYLLQVGADPNSAGADGSTPLMNLFFSAQETSEGKRKKIAELLLANGANPNQVDQKKRTALFNAVSNFSNKNSDKIIESIELLLENGANPNIFPEDQNSILHIAIEKKIFPLVLSLIEYNGDHNIQNKNGEYPLEKLITFLSLGQKDSTLLNSVSKLVEKGSVVSTDVDKRCELLRVVENAHYTLAKTLIKSGIAVDCYGVEERSPLFVAAGALVYDSTGEQEALVSELIKSGANVNSFMNDSVHLLNAVLTNVAVSGNWHIVKILLEAGADCSVIDKNGHSMVQKLLESYDHGNECVSFIQLMEKNGFSFSDPHFKGNELLVYAGNQSVDVIKYLIEKGADVNFINERGLTPLKAMVLRNNYRGVEFLLKQDAQLSYHKDLGNEISLMKNNFDSDDPEGEKNMYKMLLLLLKNGVSPDSMGRHDSYPFVYECLKYGRVNFAKLLVKYGASVNPSSVNGKTMLYHLVKSKNSEAVEFLIDRKVPITGGDSDTTLLMFSVLNKDAAMVKLLIESGVNLNKQNNTGETALFLAAHRGYVHIANMLLDKGADYLLSTNMKWSPLMEAADRGYLPIVKLLLSKDTVSINQLSSDSFTPLMAAATNGHEELVEFLLENGAIYNMENARGETALSIARENGHKSIVNILKSYPKKRSQ